MHVAYTIALFLHIVGAIGIFVGMGLELAVVARLRGATAVAQVREALWYGKLIGRLMQIAPPLTLLAGLYMTVTAWGFAQAWLDIALALFLALTVLGAKVNGGHFKGLAGEAFTAPDGPVPQSLRARILDPVVNTNLQTMVALTVGIVFLMTVKPALVWALATVAIALVLGILSAQPVRRTARELREQPAPEAGERELAAAGR